RLPQRAEQADCCIGDALAGGGAGAGPGAEGGFVAAFGERFGGDEVAEVVVGAGGDEGGGSGGVGFDLQAVTAEELAGDAEDGGVAQAEGLERGADGVRAQVEEVDDLAGLLGAAGAAAALLLVSRGLDG